MLSPEWRDLQLIRASSCSHVPAWTCSTEIPTETSSQSSATSPWLIAIPTHFRPRCSSAMCKSSDALLRNTWLTCKPKLAQGPTARQQRLRSFHGLRAHDDRSGGSKVESQGLGLACRVLKTMRGCLGTIASRELSKALSLSSWTSVVMCSASAS